MISPKRSWQGYPWLIVALLWVVAFLNYFDRILITSMRDPIVSDFSLTDAQVGLLTSVFLWSYGFLSPFGGFFADKYSLKKVIVFSVAVWSGMTLWTGFVTSFHEMLIARGFNDANLMPILRQVIDSRYIATGYGFLNLLSTIVGGGMVYLGGILQDANVDLALVYQLVAVLMLLSAWSLLTVKLKKNG